MIISRYWCKPFRFTSYIICWIQREMNDKQQQQNIMLWDRAFFYLFDVIGWNHFQFIWFVFRTVCCRCHLSYKNMLLPSLVPTTILSSNDCKFIWIIVFIYFVFSSGCLFKGSDFQANRIIADNFTIDYLYLKNHYLNTIWI